MQTREQRGEIWCHSRKKSQSLLPGLWLTFLFVANLSAPLLSDGFTGEG